ncbi:hypothetical protein [Natrinema longum]|uniref:Uncharacterized protein n=1 Tax=Natrinema longum TaxID=370324 RepID=A0A8A2U3G6_9EURY|nr:hypothetical protein [Natrinema longum]MBZ6494934.1 hypothetical protein [Natrinema longum]QSW83769.1 hypothetical protein J0X27_09760 [Natrinema longum]
MSGQKITDYGAGLQNISKRKFLRSTATAGLGFAGLAHTGLVAADEPHTSISDREQSDVIEVVKKSEQYDALDNPVVDGGFQPQFNQAEVSKFEPSEDDRESSGLVVIIPTKNAQNDDASVELTAFVPDDNPDELKLQAEAKVDDVVVGFLYTDSDLIETSEGFTSSHTALGHHDSDLVTPSSIFDPLPDFDDVRDLIDDAIEEGRELKEHGEDKFSDLSDWAYNEADDKVDTVRELSDDAYDFGVDVFSPVNGREPPEELEEAMNNQGQEHIATVDLTKSCVYVSLGSLSGVGALILSGVGVAASPIAVAFAGVVTAGCTIYGAINHFVKDAVDCSVRYAYIFANTDLDDPEEVTATAFPWCE